MAEIYDLAHEVFGKYARKLEPYSSQLSLDLVKAHMTVSREKWLSLAILATVLAFGISLLIALPAGILLYGMKACSVLKPILIAIVLAAASGALTFYYPSLVVSERKKKIENTIAFATIYMSTISRSGFPPQHLFRLLAKFKDYGEISKEAALISRDVELFGVDLPTAMTKAIARSPSADWTELLAGLRTAITIGGDLGAFLEEKAKGFVADYKRRLQDFSNLLSILIEVYITLVIVGAVFFIVTTSIIVAIGGMSTYTLKIMNFAMIIIGIPLLTGAFILIIKGVSPMAD